MNKTRLGLLLAVLAGSAASASADTVNMTFVGVGAGRSGQISYDGGTTFHGTFAGILNQSFSGPATGLGTALVGQTLQSYCIELEGLTFATRNMEITSVSNAPVDPAGNPNFNGPYGAVRAARVAAVMGAAFNAGWIDARIQSTGLMTNARAAAIQLLVWESLFEPGSNANPVGWDLTNGNFQTTGFAGAAAEVAAIVGDVATLFAGGYRFSGLRALVGQTNGNGSHTDIQDQLVVIPLPPAAWAGLGTLGAVFGLSVVRRRRLAASN